MIMACRVVRPRWTILGLIFDVYYKGCTLVYQISNLRGGGGVAFRGREQSHVFCIGFGDSENDAEYSIATPMHMLKAAFSKFVKELTNNGYEYLEWKCLKYDSVFHQLLIEAGAEIGGRKAITRIFFDMPEYDSYFLRLRKSVRQNVRTAYNRLIRDNHILDFHFYSNEYGESMPHAFTAIMRKCLAIFLKRHAEKYNITGIRHKLAQLVKWASTSRESGFLAVCSIDGEPVAFMSGHKSGAKEIWATRLAIDSDFSFYSPGMICVNETIKYLMRKTPIRCLNLGRGTEKYKMDMGGVECMATDYLLYLRK